jgi:hypothetical protein
MNVGRVFMLLYTKIINQPKSILRVLQAIKINAGLQN